MNIETNGFELGDTVRDTITRYEGIITAVSQFTTGCARVQVQGPVKKDGTVPEPVGTDVLTLEMVKKGPRHEVNRTTGGPRPIIAPRSVDLRR